jgi:hypothetical protein
MAIRNSGNTPANNVVHIANVIYREFPLAAPLPAIETVAGDPRTMSVFTVPPAGIITKNVVFPQILTSQQIAELRAATHAIYIYGRITYTDVFRGESHYQLSLPA